MVFRRTLLREFAGSWRDSEMVIWFMSGLSLGAWVRPVLVFALPLVAVIGALSLFVEPWVEQIAAQYQARMQSRDDLARVTPGEFHETASRSNVFFVESNSRHSREVNNVFTGVLEHGRRYELQPGERGYRVTRFDRYEARLRKQEVVRPPANAQALPTQALLRHRSRENLGELASAPACWSCTAGWRSSWRCSSPSACGSFRCAWAGGVAEPAARR